MVEVAWKHALTLHLGFTLTVELPVGLFAHAAVTSDSVPS